MGYVLDWSDYMVNNEYKVDMHIHTNGSDGTWDIKELLQRVIDSNIKVFSITDHDTINNSIRMADIIPNDIYYAVGVEVSTSYKGKEYHMTAYGIDDRDIKLNELLRFNQFQRMEYNEKIVRFAKTINKIENIKNYYSYSYDKKRGGWDSLNFLLDKGVVKNLGEYFEFQKLSNERLLFKSPSQIIKIIKDAGGYSFLAHPSAYENGNKLSLDILEEWRDFGIDGIECFSPYLRNIEDADHYLDFCKSNDMLISAGSDCHGEFNNRTLGIPSVDFDKVRLDFINI